MDFSFGTLKIKKSGGSAGHNGIESIYNFLGHDIVYRIRLGVDRPADNIDAKTWVLKKFLDEELHFIKYNWCRDWERMFKSLITHGVVASMNEFNKRSNE